MKITSGIRLLTGVLIAAGATVFVVLVIGFFGIRSGVLLNDSVSRALDGVFELSVLTTDYLVNGEERAVRQWQARHASLAADLDGIVVTDEENARLLERIREYHADSASIFERIIETGEVEVPDGDAGSATAQYRERLVAQLLISMQRTVTETVTLSESISDAFLANAVRTLVVVSLLSALALVVTLGTAYSVEHQVVSPLRVLQASAGKVGSGNLEHRTGLDARRDEVGDLARAFDDMVADLRRSYVMLENEIGQHRITRADLDRHKDGLERLVEVRTSELEFAMVKLEAATAAKDQFFAAMSHELRTPLNSIIGFSDIVLKGRAGSINDEQRRQLTMVNRSGKQLLSMISDLLDLARIEAGHIDVVSEDVDLRELSSRVVAMMEPVAAEKGLEVTSAVEHQVPRSFYSDGGKIEQILLNVLSNAVKFTDEGSVRLGVARCEGAEGEIVFTVTDTGAGIPAGDIDRIFERFQQVAPVRTAKAPGTGLGLAICRDLAHALGGGIEVESELGVGSSFRIVLPERRSRSGVSM